MPFPDIQKVICKVFLIFFTHFTLYIIEMCPSHNVALTVTPSYSSWWKLLANVTQSNHIYPLGIVIIYISSKHEKMAQCCWSHIKPGLGQCLVFAGIYTPWNAMEQYFIQYAVLFVFTHVIKQPWFLLPLNMPLSNYYAFNFDSRVQVCSPVTMLLLH